MAFFFKYTILINNTQEKIWNFLIDVERWKEWDTEVTKSKLKGNFQLKAKGNFKPKGGPKLYFKIIELVPNQSYTFKARMPFCSFVVKRTLKPKENRIEFTDQVQFTGLLKSLYGYLLSERLKKALPTVLENFKRIVELQ